MEMKEMKMRTITVAALALLMAPIGARADQLALTTTELRAPAAEAPEPWSQQDPADSLYRAAREAMNDGEHERAADLFNRVWNRYPRSTYAPDAPYWEAFNRYRLGTTSHLERALELLELQAERYEDAATRTNGDARSLRMRVAGMLAGRGNAEAAEAIVASANAVAGIGAEIGAEVGARMAVLAEEMAIRGEMLGEQIARAVQEGVGGGIVVRHGTTADIPQECREQVQSQLAALNALINMNADRALPVLKRVMARRDECSTPLRRRAVFMIADKRSPETVDILLDVAKDDPDVEVRRQAVFWLSEVDDPRAVEALESFVLQSDDDQIRQRAIFALSQHDSPRSKQILRRVAQDESMPDPLRSKAIFWLGTEGSDQDLDFLKDMFGRFDRSLDEQILFTIGQAERSSDARWLLSIAADAGRPMELRRMAIFWAAEAGASATTLGELYDRLDDRQLKERILFGLSESDQPQAIDRLIRIVRTEKDTRLREKAIFWLGNSDDPRAADVLMEVLMEGGGGR